METKPLTDVGSAAENQMNHAFTAMLSSYDCPQFSMLPNDGCIFISGCAYPLGNFAIPSGAEQTIECARKLADAGYISALLYPSTDETEPETEIGKFGFASVGAMPAMAVEIKDIPTVSIPEGYTFKRSKAGEDNADWSKAFGLGYGIPDDLAEYFNLNRIPIDDAPDAELQFFEVRKGDQVVGVSAMYLGLGVAGIYCVATLPEHRGKGIGALVTAEPLRQAAEVGYEIGILQASEMGYSVYKKLGFRDVGSIRMYLRNPSANA